MSLMRANPLLRRPDTVVILAALLVVAGIYLRLRMLGFPPNLTWDEHHFVINARNYLAGKPDWNDHPPLGKFFMAAAIKLWGDHATAFRLPSALFGMGSVLAGGLIGRALFPFRAAGLMAAAMLAIDGFLIAYSRTALLDGMLTCFILFSFYFAWRAKGMGSMVAASIFAALAVSTKTSGVLAVLPIIYFSLERRRWPWLLSLAVIPPLFYAQWAYGLYLTGKPYDVASAWTVQADLMRHHAGLTEMKHPLTSRWFTWLIPLRTLPLRYDADALGNVHVMNSLGHPLLWWTSSVLVVLGTLRGLLRGLAAELKPDADEPARSTNLLANHRSIAQLLLMWWLFMSPWVLTRRDSYIYHYLPSYAFGLILTGGCLAWLCQTRAKLGLFALALIAGVAIFYAPVCAQFPLRPEHVAWRLFLPGWR